MKKKHLYTQVYESIKMKIINEEYLVNQQIPVEYELVEEYKVSVITIKKALNMLVEEGYLERITRRGTFVRKIEVIAESPLDVEERSINIGVVFEHVHSAFGLELMYALDEFAQQSGMNMIYRFSFSDINKENYEINHLLSMGIDGLIIMPSHGIYYNKNILKLINEKFPIVLFDKMIDGFHLPLVKTDNEHAIQELVKHLYKKGHRKIGYFTNNFIGTTSLIERRLGFYKAVMDYKIDILDEVILQMEIPMKENNVFNEAILENFFREHGESLDAVVLSEYGLLPLCIPLFQKYNIDFCTIDGDIDNPFGLQVTNMKQNEREIGRKIVELMAKMLKGDHLHRLEYKIPAIFHQGKSA